MCGLKILRIRLSRKVTTENSSNKDKAHYRLEVLPLLGRPEISICYKVVATQLLLTQAVSGS